MIGLEEREIGRRWGRRSGWAFFLVWSQLPIYAEVSIYLSLPCCSGMIALGFVVALYSLLNHIQPTFLLPPNAILSRSFLSSRVSLTTSKSLDMSGYSVTTLYRFLGAVFRICRQSVCLPVLDISLWLSCLACMMGLLIVSDDDVVKRETKSATGSTGRRISGNYSGKKRVEDGIGLKREHAWRRDNDPFFCCLI